MTWQLATLSLVTFGLHRKSQQVFDSFQVFIGEISSMSKAFDLRSGAYGGGRAGGGRGAGGTGSFGLGMMKLGGPSSGGAAAQRGGLGGGDRGAAGMGGRQ